jgi:hypothetical protein
MSDQTNPKPTEKVAEEPSFTKYGVECGGPDKPVAPGAKEAAEGCGDCGGKHPHE